LSPKEIGTQLTILGVDHGVASAALLLVLIARVDCLEIDGHLIEAEHAKSRRFLPPIRRFLCLRFDVENADIRAGMSTRIYETRVRTSSHPRSQPPQRQL
jgi:hypothetical protein